MNEFVNYEFIHMVRRGVRVSVSTTVGARVRPQGELVMIKSRNELINQLLSWGGGEAGAMVWLEVGAGLRMRPKVRVRIMLNVR